MSNITGDVIDVLVKLGLVESNGGGGVTPGLRKITNATTGAMVLIGADGIEIVVADYAASTFASLPDPATVQAGVPHYVSDVGVGGSTWFSNGTRWLPQGGSVVVGQVSGSLAAPIATLTGVTSGIFTHPTVKFPAGMLVSGVSKINIEALVSRVGANGTGLIRVAFGTDAVPDDVEWVYGLAMAATNLQVLRINTDFFPGNGTAFVENWAPLNTVSVDSVSDRVSAKFNTLQDQYLNFRLSAANALDSFKLLAYRVVVFP